MKFTKEEINLCKQITEKYKKNIEYGGWYINFDIEIRLKTFSGKGYREEDCVPLWTISGCLEFLRQEGFNHIFNFMRFKNGNWRFTAEDNKYRKLWGEGKTQLEACLKTILEEAK